MRALKIAERPEAHAVTMRAVDRYRLDQRIVPAQSEGGTHPIRKLGVVSGGAGGEFLQAVDAKLDAYITGEPIEPALHLAREERVHFLACGHYRSERLGIIALGDRLQEELDVPVKFVDLPNPV